MIIGIGGCSRSGKSMLTDALIWEFRQANKQVFAIHIDDFVKKIEVIPLINNQTDWESAFSIDVELLNQTIGFFASKVDILIIEGYHFFNFEKLVKQSDFRILIEISEEEFFKRRKKETRWGKEEDWYLEHVWKTWQIEGKKYLKKEKTLILDGNLKLNIKNIIKQIEK